MAFLFLVLILSPAVEANEVSVTNFSFEEPSRADGGFLDNNVLGWVGSGSTVGVFNPVNTHYPNATGASAALPSPADGLQLAYINNDGTLTTQNAILTVTNNTTYSLTVAVGSRIDAPPDGSIYRISLLIDDIEVAYTSLLVDDVVLAHGSFTNLSASFSTTNNDPRTGGALKIRLHYDEDNTTFGQGNFDNVRLSAESSALPRPYIADLVVDGGFCSLWVTNLDARADYTILKTDSLPSPLWSTTGTFRATSTATNLFITVTNTTLFFKVKGQPY